MDNYPSKIKAVSIRLLRQLKTPLLLIITVLVLYITYRNIPFSEFKTHFHQAKKQWLYIGSIWFCIWPFLTAYRFFILVNVNHKVAFKKICKYNFAAMFYNSILPSKGGDLLRAIFLKQNHNIPLSTGGGLVLFDKAVDYLSLISVIFIGVFFVPFNWLTIIAVGIVISSSIIVFYLIINTSYRLNFKRQWLSNIAFRIEQLKTLYISLAKGKAIPFLFILALINNLGNYLQIWCFLKAFNISITFFESLYYVPIAVIIGMIPITINGMGTRDGVLLQLLQNYGSSASIALGGIAISVRTYIGGLIGLILAPGYVLFNKAKD